MTCNETSTVSAQGCTSCTPNCLKCDTNPLSCERCKPGFSFPTTVLRTCTMQCLVTNCDQCQDGNQNICRLCLPGFRRNAISGCEKCAVAGCSSCNSDINACDYTAGVNTCLDKQYLLDGRCTACPNGCLKCDAGGVCIQCDTGAGFYMWKDMTCNFGLYFSVTCVVVAVSLAAFLN